MEYTETQKKALLFLKDTSLAEGITASRFAELMWPDSHMHTSSKNQGNGATTGKAAWLCGGSYIAKLKKLGWVTDTFEKHTSYCITDKGKYILYKMKVEDYEN